MNVLLLHVNDVARFWDNFIKLFTQNYDAIKNILVKGYMLSIRAFHIRSHRRAREILRRWSESHVVGLEGKTLSQSMGLQENYILHRRRI